jgi:hypothetical protein
MSRGNAQRTFRVRRSAGQKWARGVVHDDPHSDLLALDRGLVEPDPVRGVTACDELHQAFGKGAVTVVASVTSFRV